MDLRAPTAAIAALPVLLLAGCGDGGELADPPADDQPATEAHREPAGERPHRGPPEDTVVRGVEPNREPQPGATRPIEPDDLEAQVEETALTVRVAAPDGWEQADEDELRGAGAGASAVVYLNEEACDASFCAHFHALVMGGPVTSLEEYHERSREEIEEVLDAELLAEERVEVDGHPGYQVAYRADDEHGELRYLQRYAVVDDEAVVVTFTATPELFDAWRDDAEAMLESVEIDAEQ